jgi:hypothetical protein
MSVLDDMYQRMLRFTPKVTVDLRVDMEVDQSNPNPNPWNSAHLGTRGVVHTGILFRHSKVEFLIIVV